MFNLRIFPMEGWKVLTYKSLLESPKAYGEDENIAWQLYASPPQKKIYIYSKGNAFKMSIIEFVK